MSNTYFRFRQFTVHQENTAMKVCTDACLFGAWVASEAGDRPIERILDIGAGTGLLSLMLAQNTSALIDAVELDTVAYEQASENFKASPWNDRLKAYNTAVQHFTPSYQYDLVITNPPFYEHDLKSPDDKRNRALHGTDLAFDELVQCAKRLMKTGGATAVLIPYSRHEFFEEKVIATGFVIYKKVNIKQSIKHGYFRCMYMLKEVGGSFAEKEIAVRDDEFNLLLKDYYL